jgi:hypothetical protein
MPVVFRREAGTWGITVSVRRRTIRRSGGAIGTRRAGRSRIGRTRRRRAWLRSTGRAPAWRARRRRVVRRRAWWRSVVTRRTRRRIVGSLLRSPSRRSGGRRAIWTVPRRRWGRRLPGTWTARPRAPTLRRGMAGGCRRLAWSARRNSGRHGRAARLAKLARWVILHAAPRALDHRRPPGTNPLHCSAFRKRDASIALLFVNGVVPSRGWQESRGSAAWGAPAEAGAPGTARAQRSFSS